MHAACIHTKILLSLYFQVKSCPAPMVEGYLRSFQQQVLELVFEMLSERPQEPIIRLHTYFVSLP